jgi:hypothetical protein
VSCYLDNTDPTIESFNTSLQGATSSSLGCTTTANIVGREVNNNPRYTIEINDGDGTSDIKAALLWLTPNGGPGNTDTVQISTGTPQTQSNSSFGVLIGYYNNSWRVFVPRYTGSAWRWVDEGSIGNGERARIGGSTPEDMIIVSDVSVTDLDATTKRFSLNLEYLNTTSGITNLESISSNTYNVFASAQDTATFMNQDISWTNVGTQNIDLTPPTINNSYEPLTAETLSLEWQVSDTNGILRTMGNADIGEAGVSNGPIDDITSGVSNYILGSGPEMDSSFYDSSGNLWVLNSTLTRDEVIDINSNEGGSLLFPVTSFDNACNDRTETLDISLEEAWMITKGGVLFSGGGTNLDIREFSTHEFFSPDDYWQGYYKFYKDEADLSTELLSGGTATLNNLIHSATVGSTRATSYLDRNNRQGYWFDRLSERVDLILAATQADEYDNFTFETDITIGVSASNVSQGGSNCGDSELCVVEVIGNMDIQSGFVCDAKAVFLVDGEIIVEPDITNQDSTSACYFISSGNITIDDGAYKSSGSSYPRYDILQAFFLSDENIIISEVDQGEDVRDGLKVDGSLLAFGSGANSSILMQRTLKLLDNTNFPAVAIHYDQRYLKLSPLFFGGHTDAFKQEVGFKPL